MRDSQDRLEKIRIGWSLAMPDCVLSDAWVDIDHSQEFRAVISEINGYVWGQQLAEDVYSYPATWWDALKANWAPYWFVRRFPIRERKFRVHFNVMYPNFKMAMPDEPMTIRAIVRAIDDEEPEV